MLLNSEDYITQLIRSKNIFNWTDLIRFVQKIPYGRNSSRAYFELVITENKGSCSSKHALLKTIADLNTIKNVNLILGIYKMNSINTPKIGLALKNNGLSYIPEAHCYLKINGNRHDYTSISSNIKTIENDILEEQVITPKQVVNFKVNYHKNYLKNWIKKENITFGFEDIWAIREQCIKKLAL